MSKSVRTVTVRTKAELEKAYESRAERIVVQGKLAKQLKDGKKIRNLGKKTIMILSAAVAAAPFTGGASLAAAAPVALLTGTSAVLVIAVAAIGIVLLKGFWKDYEEEEEEIEFSIEPYKQAFRLKRKAKR